MAFFIPVGEGADNIQRVQLGTQTYDFRFRWNTLEEAWYLSIGLNGEDPKVQFKMSVGMDLLAPHQAYLDQVPSGNLILIDNDSEYGRPGKDNTGIDKRFTLIYIEEGEDISNLFAEE